LTQAHANIRKAALQGKERAVCNSRGRIRNYPGPGRKKRRGWASIPSLASRGGGGKYKVWLTRQKKLFKNTPHILGLRGTGRGRGRRDHQKNGVSLRNKKLIARGGRPSKLRMKWQTEAGRQRRTFGQRSPGKKLYAKKGSRSETRTTPSLSNQWSKSRLAGLTEGRKPQLIRNPNWIDTLQGDAGGWRLSGPKESY